MGEGCVGKRVVKRKMKKKTPKFSDEKRKMCEKSEKRLSHGFFFLRSREESGAERSGQRLQCWREAGKEGT